MRIIAIFWVVALASSAAIAATTTGPGDQSTVAAWHSAASTGDVYIIEPGEWQWTSSGRFTLSKAVSIFGSGWGEGGTVIEFQRDTTGSFTPMIVLSGDDWRFSNLEIHDDVANPESGNKSINDIVRIAGGSGWCFDNIRYTENPSVDAYRHLIITGQSGTPGTDAKGLIWACEFLADSQTVYFSAGDGGYGDAGWNTDPPLGTADQVVWEECKVAASASFDGSAGGRSTIRFSEITDSRVGNHGAESSGRDRSHRYWEVYKNEFDFVSVSNRSEIVEMRGGSAMVFDNTITQHPSTNNPSRVVGMSNYRASSNFNPWGAADGKNLWDVNSTDDGAGTPGGAGDGVYESGTVTSVEDDYNLTDSSKAGSWTAEQWVGYTFRPIGPTITAATGSSGTSIVVDPDPGWTTNEWAGWKIRNTSTGAMQGISSNTSDTINTATSLNDSMTNYNVSVGQEFEIYRAALIRGTGTDGTLHLRNRFDGGPEFVPQAGWDYEIRLVLGYVDGIGMGTASNDIPGGDAIGADTGPVAIDLGQAIGGTPIYIFQNSVTSGSINQSARGETGTSQAIVEDLVYYVEAASFDGTSGVGVGVKADISPGGDHESASTVGVGYWVTDEANWDTTTPETDGQLYQWNGSAWVLYYTPLEYPHPLRASLAALPGAAGAAYTGRLLFNGTGAKPVRTDGVGQPIIFDQ